MQGGEKKKGSAKWAFRGRAAGGRQAGGQRVGWPGPGLGRLPSGRDDGRAGPAGLPPVLDSDSTKARTRNRPISPRQCPRVAPGSAKLDPKVVR